MDIKRVTAKRREVKAAQYNKNHCKKHLDWKPLTHDELLKVRKSDRWGMMIYKNVFPDWHRTNISMFVTDEMQDEYVLPYLNPVNYNEIGMRHKKNLFQDKNYQPVFANKLKFPQTIARNINGEWYDDQFDLISLEEVIAKLNEYSKLVFKKTMMTGHGLGVKLVEKDDYSEVINEWKKNFIVQMVVHQCNELAYWNASSVNVVRITSLFWKGEVYILGGILRVGAPGAFCDHLGFQNENPRVIGVYETGELYHYCIDPDGEKKYDDCFGKKIEGVVPCYDKMLTLVKETHKFYPHNRLIGWDITVDDNYEVICIEYNPDQPGITQTQMAVGPIFGKLSIRGCPLLKEIIHDIKNNQ